MQNPLAMFNPVTKSFPFVNAPFASGSERMVILSIPLGPFGGASGTLSQTVRRYWSCLTGLSPA